MRYVRFGQDSKPTAILFALLELAKYPRYQLLRGKIVREVAEKKLEGPAKRIFDFAMCPIVPSTDLLQAWNCDDSSFSRTIMRCFDANSAPMNHINTSIERLKRLYNFETVKYGEESEVTDQTQITVYWDQSPGGSVQLLYTKYDMDSFYVTTKCSHIHLKFALNTKAKELMDKSNKESEFRQKEFICKVADCRKIISDEVFIISQKNAVVDTHSAQVVKAVLTDTKHTIEECYQSLMRRKETACQYCRKREGLKICSGDCSICRECAAVACFTPYHLCCPVCGHRIKRDQITSVLNIAKTVNLKGTSDVVNCDQCRTDKPIEQYAKSIRVKHHCMVCNECFPTSLLARKYLHH